MIGAAMAAAAALGTRRRLHVEQFGTRLYGNGRRRPCRRGAGLDLFAGNEASALRRLKFIWFLSTPLPAR
jgi:hypothetical protein